MELRENDFVAENPRAKFDLISNWLAERFANKKEAPEYLLDFIEKLQNEPVTHLNKIIITYPVSQKKLIEHFKKYVGLTPKYYHRILQFNEILKIINKNERLPWAEVA
ncbi:MAG: hypothetical protein IPL42_05740 [Saprospiraceae bacterium]|nr:hypothetical protein [Saprospiraceae bacterium]